ncbi:MAG: preprotein translocase subunit SecY, preprotein translocase subunit SecY [Parcubacteria group bacterium]|nr:preprotein translocase subunit SecY, preprotein translocase subunit SecY [Parcubacteria group bacterium]
MQEAKEKFKLVFKDRVLRNRILITLGLLVIARLLAVIPLPGIDASRLGSLLSTNQFLSLFNIFSGGGLSSFSIVLLAVGPYVTASIVMQLLTVLVPKFKSMYQEEGDAGRRKFSQYSRMLTVPLALLQGYAFIILLEKQAVLPTLALGRLGIDLVILVAGSMLLVWIGELITEFGIGNGISLIIFAGIVSRLPANIGQLLFTYDASQLPVYIAAIVAMIAVIFGVVYISEAERPIPVTYSKPTHGGTAGRSVSTYLPLRVNQAGVIPIIFALSILLFPQMILQFLVTSSNLSVAHISNSLLALLNNQWFYAATYFVLVFVFTYFYTAVTFDPDQISENLQKSGGYIPGVRPGNSTAEYISRILLRLTLVGALFLAVIAVLPLVLRALTGAQSLAIGGTALLIVVSVVIDLVKKIDAQVSAQEY